MRLLVDAFWRSAAYCVHPRVIALSLLPLVLLVAGCFALGYWFWDDAIAALNLWLEGYALFGTARAWLDGVGLPQLGAVLAPLMVLALATPVIVIVALLAVALFMTPSMVELVAQRRFPRLERKQGGSFWSSLAWSLGSTLLALLVLVLSMPLWLVPPLVMVLPPLIWGWLTYRVFAYDALSSHASREERQQLLARHRSALLVMGLLSGFLGGAPSLIWASGAMFIALAPLLVPLAIWIYALVFAFASLWFAHFLLSALERLRAEVAATTTEPAVRPASGADVIDVTAKFLP